MTVPRASGPRGCAVSALCVAGPLDPPLVPDHLSPGTHTKSRSGGYAVDLES